MDIIYFGFLLLFYLNQNAFANTTPPAPSTSRPPLCPDIMCTLEFIPEECRETPIITLGGVTCSDCPKWKENCRESLTSASTVTISSPTVCPDLNCPKLDAPKECIVEKTYIYNGITCKECPVKRIGCPSTKQQVDTTNELVACPILDCGPIRIPEHCREVVQYEFMGRNCSRCPSWRSGCDLSKPSVPQKAPSDRPVAQLACPLYKCDADIPAECSVPQKQVTPSGRICARCPKWRKGCREQERIATNNGLQKPMDSPAIKLNQRPDVPCPYFRCPSNTIPKECIEEQPFQFNGKTCFRCPRWRTGCQGSPVFDRQQERIPEIACPLMKCDLPDLPQTCFLEEMFQFHGKMCHKCPRVKDECQTVVPPRPVAQVDPSIQVPNGQRVNEIACPLQACPLIYIPKECQEFDTFEFRGRICKRCPRFRPGCLPMGTIPQAPAPSQIPQIPNIPQIPSIPAIECPQIGCPFIYIPPECREQPTYNYQGITCNHCVRWREGCVPGSPANNQQPEAPPCPMFQCELVQIPKECIEVPTIYIRGRNCTTCPRQKDGCIPNGQNIDQNMLVAIPTKKPITSAQKEVVVCPMVACNKMLIPSECRDETPYQFQGKTCFKCPVWREGCIPGQKEEVSCPMVACTLMLIPDECRVEKPYRFRGKTCYDCPVWREGCVPGQLGPGKPDVACPMVACNKMLIPTECREEKPYQFQGKNCFDCPVWRDGCVPGRKEEVACPMVACNRMLIPAECREETPYTFQGKTCFKCPVWRDGCVPGRKEEVACPMVACNRMLIPAECREETPYQFQGKTCFKCPVWRDGCVPGRKEEVACPMVACNRMLIPSECREETPYQFQGKTCFKCPVWRDGCVPGRKEEVACPMVACNRMLIPAECREETPYTFQGKTCFKCPVWRDGCVPGQKEVVSCPLIACTLMLIPDECRVERSYQFRGRTCKDCPVWREGCVPGTKQSVDKTTNNEVPAVTIGDQPSGRKIACPLMRCNKMYIPPECRERPTYLFMGTQTCYRCPKWREGCVPGEQRQVVPIDVNNPNTDTQNIPTNTKSDITQDTTGINQNPNPVINDVTNTGSSKTISGMKRVLPVDRFLEMVNQIQCPPLPCPAVYIPPRCMETVPYIYQGRLCRGCPRWRYGCSALDGQWQNSNFDGLLAYNLFRELAGFGA